MNSIVAMVRLLDHEIIVRAQGDIRNTLSTGAGGTKITIERDKAVTTSA